MATTTDLAELRLELIASLYRTRASVLESMDALGDDLRDLANLIARRQEAAEMRGAKGDNTTHISGRGGRLIVEVDEIASLLAGISAANLARTARDYAVAAGQVEVLPDQAAAAHGSPVPSLSDGAVQEAGLLADVKLSRAQIDMLRRLGKGDTGPQRFWWGATTQDALARRGLARRIDVDGTAPLALELTDAGREVLRRLSQEG
jgi:hypothetical protein